LIKYKLNKEFWYSIIPPAAGLIFLLVEYKGIYLTANHAEKEISTVIINPFYSYTRIEPLWLLPFSLLFSLLFPVCYAALNYSKLKKSELFWYTSLSFFVSVIIYLFFAETGPRATHGNFIWQVIICTWLCFFVSLLSLIRDIKIQGKTIKNKLLMSLYLIHVLMGVGYFIRLFVTGYYG
jgi:hypothetical protein